METGYRHEYKYLISPQAAYLLKHRLPHLMKLDPHVAEKGQYTIRSLYFDDLVYSAFYEKVSGVDERTKYRIRCYDYDMSLFRLEKKEKKGHLTRKAGQTITLADVQALQKASCERCPDATGELVEELRLGCMGTGLRPAALVDYDRTPFVCADGNTRITLDENLRTVPYCTDLFGPIHGMLPVLEDGQVILEVKFDDFLPGHLGAALGDIPKIPMAISKFAMCLNVI